jgi:hypothetical protein
MLWIPEHANWLRTHGCIGSYLFPHNSRRSQEWMGRLCSGRDMMNAQYVATFRALVHANRLRTHDTMTYSFLQLPSSIPLFACFLRSGIAFTPLPAHHEYDYSHLTSYPNLYYLALHVCLTVETVTCGRLSFRHLDAD